MKDSGVAAAFAVVASLFFAPGSLALAAEYYVGNSGDDANVGTNSSRPWETISKVNCFEFSPGDIVRFEKGAVWREQLIPHRGSEKGYVTYTSCGLQRPQGDAQTTCQPATERTPVIGAYEQMRYGIFIHFGIITFLDQSFQDAKKGPLPPSRTYCPTDLDVDQWIATAKKAGMQYAVLSVKHHLGHALWDSKYTDYDVATSPCKTDVVGEFVKACRKHGVAPCFLYSLGQDIAHRRDKAMTDDEWYAHANHQIAELLTDYGPITTIWFDGMGGGDFPERRVREAYETVKSLQPDCLVVMHAHGAYNRRLKRWPSDVLQLFLTQPPSQGHDPWMKHNGKTYCIPMEVVAVLFKERDWFWRPRQKPLPVASLLKPYRDATSRGANLTLTAAPDRTGKLPADQVERLLQLAEAIEEGI